MGKQKSKLHLKVLSLFFILLLFAQIFSVLLIFSKTSKAATAINRSDSFAWSSGNEIVDQTKSVSFIKHDEFNTGLQGWALNEDPGCEILENSSVTIDHSKKSIYNEEAQKAFGGTTFSAFMIYNKSFGDDTLTLRNGAVDLHLFTVTKSANSNFCQYNDLGTVRPAIQNATNYFKYQDTYTIVSNNFGDRGSETDDKAFEAIKDMVFTLVDPSNDYFYNLIKQRNDIPKDAIVYAEPGEGDCQSYIVLDTTTSGRGPSARTNVNASRGTLYVYSIKSNDCKAGIDVTLSKPRSHTARVYASPKEVGISNANLFNENKAKNPEAGRATGGASASGSTAETCEGGIPVLGWIICSIVDIASKFAGQVDNMLESILIINTNEYNKDQGIKTAWSAIRIIATVVLLGVALFMIIAQMLNLDVVSAYTFKKMIPRIVAGVILMQLSWYIGIFLIDVFNLLGAAIAELIAAPFGGAAKLSTIASIINNYYAKTGGGAQAGAFTFAGIAIVGGIAAVGGAFGLLALALTVAIAALVAFITLVLREVVVLGLLVIAPLAIVAWLLPNTQGWWKKYWDTLIKLLFMFPLVMGALMLGKVFASIVAKAGSTGLNSSVNFFIIVIAYFAPWFFIPSMIKASGTIFAKGADAIQGLGKSMSKKGGDVIKKEGTSYMESKYKAGHRLRNFGVRTMTGNPNITRRGSALLAARGMQYTEQKKKDNDLLVASATYGMSHPDRVKKLQELALQDNEVGEAAARGLHQLKQYGIYDADLTIDPATGKPKRSVQEAQRYRDLAIKRAKTDPTGIGADLFDHRRDITTEGDLVKPGGMSVKDLGNMHGSFYKNRQNVSDIAEHDLDALEELATNPQWATVFGQYDHDAQENILQALTNRGRTGKLPRPASGTVTIPPANTAGASPRNNPTGA